MTLSGSRMNVIVVNMDDTLPETLEGSFMTYLATNPEGGWMNLTGLVTSPICGPSRASLLTGWNSSHHGATTNTDIINNVDGNLDPTKWFTNSLRRSGYQCGLFGKYQNGYPWSDFSYRPEGWDRWVAYTRPGNGSGVYFGFRAMDQSTELGTNNTDWSTDYLFSEAADWIASMRQPFFCYIAPKSPHASNEEEETPERLAGDFDEQVITKGDNFNPASAPGKPAAYPASVLDAGEIETADEMRRVAMEHTKGVDENLQTLIEGLSTKQLNRTVIIITGDNSNHFGEHRLVGKGTFYEQSVRVPFMVRVPGGSNSTSSALVSNEDIAPTVCDIAGCAPPLSPDGMSIVPVLDGSVDGDDFRESVLLYQSTGGNGDGVCVREKQWKYTEYDNDDVELYDLNTDPVEMVNVNESNTVKAAEMASKLAVLREQQIVPAEPA